MQDDLEHLGGRDVAAVERAAQVRLDLEVEAFAGFDLLSNRLERAQGENGDQLLLSTTAQVRASSSSLV